jgi:hypothetical protein
MRCSLIIYELMIIGKMAMEFHGIIVRYIVLSYSEFRNICVIYAKGMSPLILLIKMHTSRGSHLSCSNMSPLILLIKMHTSRGSHLSCSNIYCLKYSIFLANPIVVI